MEKLWKGYISGELQLDISLRKAYANLYNINEKWLEIENQTLGDYVKNCVSELENAGYILDNTPLSVLEEKFLLLKVTITAPQEYIDLTECLNDIDDQIKECDAKGYNTQIKSQLISIKEKIEERIKAIG